MAALPPESDWRWQLSRRLTELGPMVRRQCEPEPDGAPQVPGTRFLEPDFLRASIERARPPAPASGAEPLDADLRIAASRMSRAYCAALTCVAFVGLAGGVGIDLSPGRYTVGRRGGMPSPVTIGAGRDVPWCAERPTSWPVSGRELATLDELRAYVWTNLYARNLAPMFAAATEVVHVPVRLLWTNAAEWVATMMDVAVAFLGPEGAAPYVADCRAVLTADSLPGLPGPNPLRGLVEWLPHDDGAPRHGIQTRRLCCLVYRHSDRDGRLCFNCPLLPLPDRAALIRERQWAGVASPDGPAERRCAEVGRTRLAMATRKARRPRVSR